MRISQLTPLVAASLVALVAPPVAAAFELRYEHDLATPSGKLRTGSVMLSSDPYTGEVYVIGYGQVRIFNPAGMQVFSFGDDADAGSIRGVAALESGDLVLLALKDGRTSLVRADYRGEVIGPFHLSGLPDGLAEFGANRLLQGDGKLFLVDERGMRLLVATEAGAYVASYDLAELAAAAEKRDEIGISGCGVDTGGRFLFTVAPLFKVHVLAPDGTVRVFGRPGGAPGKFNVVAGVGADEEGRIYVVDALKSAVSAWDPDLSFLGEYGYRGSRPGNLVRPSALVVSGGRVYVSQSGTSGVAVFRIVADRPQASVAASGG